MKHLKTYLLDTIELLSRLSLLHAWCRSGSDRVVDYIELLFPNQRKQTRAKAPVARTTP